MSFITSVSADAAAVALTLQLLRVPYGPTLSDSYKLTEGKSGNSKFAGGGVGPLVAIFTIFNLLQSPRSID